MRSTTRSGTPTSAAPLGRPPRFDHQASGKATEAVPPASRADTKMPTSRRSRFRMACSAGADGLGALHPTRGAAAMPCESRHHKRDRSRCPPQRQTRRWPGTGRDKPNARLGSGPTTIATANDRPMLMPIMAMALVRCCSRVRSGQQRHHRRRNRPRALQDTPGDHAPRSNRPGPPARCPGRRSPAPGKSPADGRCGRKSCRTGSATAAWVRP